jgi:hypothetical protein
MGKTLRSILGTRLPALFGAVALTVTMHFSSGSSLAARLAATSQPVEPTTGLVLASLEPDTALLARLGPFAPEESPVPSLQKTESEKKERRELASHHAVEAQKGNKTVWFHEKWVEKYSKEWFTMLWQERHGELPVEYYAQNTRRLTKKALSAYLASQRATAPAQQAEIKTAPPQHEAKTLAPEKEAKEEVAWNRSLDAALGEALLASAKRHIGKPYDFYGNGCSLFLRKAFLEAAGKLEEAGLVTYKREILQDCLGYTSEAEIVTTNKRSGRKSVGQSKIDVSQLRSGSIIGLRLPQDRTPDFAQDRALRISHIAFCARDANGKMWIGESTAETGPNGKDGVRIMPVESWLKKYEGCTFYVASLTEAARMSLREKREKVEVAEKKSADEKQTWEIAANEGTSESAKDRTPLPPLASLQALPDPVVSGLPVDRVVHREALSILEGLPQPSPSRPAPQVFSALLPGNIRAVAVN